MLIALFGGTGRVGSLVLSQALKSGHNVRAFARDARRLPRGRVSLAVVEGQLDDGHSVAMTLAGAEAVICCLAAGNGTLARFDRVALPYLALHGPRRIVSMVGAAVRMPGDPDTRSLRFMSALMRLVPGRLLADATAHAEALARSNLDWTLARAANHANRPAGAPVHVANAFPMPLNASISRADLATFMLDEVVSPRFLRQAPMIENR